MFWILTLTGYIVAIFSLPSEFSFCWLFFRSIVHDADFPSYRGGPLLCTDIENDGWKMMWELQASLLQC